MILICKNTHLSLCPKGTHDGNKARMCNVYNTPKKFGVIHFRRQICFSELNNNANNTVGYSV